MFSFGIGELIVIFFVAIFSFAVPAAILFMLVKIYLKVKKLEEREKDK
jgi:large-conductance mechanosensitive channel